MGRTKPGCGAGFPVRAMIAAVASFQILAAAASSPCMACAYTFSVMSALA
jgi:hypothetical protein